MSFFSLAGFRGFSCFDRGQPASVVLEVLISEPVFIGGDAGWTRAFASSARSAFSQDQSSALALLFQQENRANAAALRLRLRGVERARNYQLTVRRIPGGDLILPSTPPTARIQNSVLFQCGFSLFSCAMQVKRAGLPQNGSPARCSCEIKK